VSKASPARHAVKDTASAHLQVPAGLVSLVTKAEQAVSKVVKKANILEKILSTLHAKIVRRTAKKAQAT
jgi:hypothetical protein